MRPGPLASLSSLVSIGSYTMSKTKRARISSSFRGLRVYSPSDRRSIDDHVERELFQIGSFDGSRLGLPGQFLCRPALRFRIQTSAPRSFSPNTAARAAPPAPAPESSDSRSGAAVPAVARRPQYRY